MKKNYFTKLVFVFVLLFSTYDIAKAQYEEYERKDNDFAWTETRQYTEYKPKKGKKVSYWSFGAKVNGKTVVPCKYHHVIYKEDHFLAYIKYREIKLQYGTNEVYDDVSADIYDINGNKLYNESDGIINIKNHKELSTIFVQKSDHTWYDRNSGRKVYYGGWSRTYYTSGRSDDKYYGDWYMVQSARNGYHAGKVYYEYNNKNTTKSVDIYAPDGSYIGSLPNIGDINLITALRFNPLGDFFLHELGGSNYKYYDAQLQPVNIKKEYYGPGYLITIQPNESNEKYVFDANGNDTIYVPELKDKDIVDARGYKKADIVIIKMSDGKCYDKKGNFLYKSNSEYLPSEDDLMIAPDNKMYIRTKDNTHYGLSTLDGTEILAPEFSNVQLLANGNILFEMNGYQGVINPNGTFIINLDRQYTNITYNRTFKKYFFEKAGGYKGECNEKGVQTSIVKN